MLSVSSAGNGMRPGMREPKQKRGLLQTETTAWDCAGEARFLAGNKACWITKALFAVDTGAIRQR